MQKLFIVESEQGVKEVNQWIGDTGFIVSVTAQFVSAGTPENYSFGGKIEGKWLIVAEKR